MAYQPQPNQSGNLAECWLGHSQSLHCDCAQRREGGLLELDPIGHPRYEVLGDAYDLGVVCVTRTRARHAIANGKICDAFSDARHEARARITKRLRCIQPRGHGSNRGQRALLDELPAHLFDEIRSATRFSKHRLACEVHGLFFGSG